METDNTLKTEDVYLLSCRHIRLLDTVFRKHYKQCDLQVLERQVLEWAALVLSEERKEWAENRANSIKILCRMDKKEEARNRAKARDKKFAPFREKFKQIQKEQWNTFQKKGKKLSANAFAEWFLQNTAHLAEIPYVKSNAKNRLIQLAQANNREFKKAFESKS